MAIIFNKEAKTYTIQTKNTTYQMKVNPLGVLLHTYYGRKIEGDDLGYTAYYDMSPYTPKTEYIKGDETWANIDHIPQEISAFGCGDYRETAISIRHADGTLGLQPIFHSAEIKKGKYSLDGLPAFYGDEGETLIVTLKDRVYDVYLHLYYGVLPEYDLITRALIIENKTDNQIHIEKALSLNLDFNFGDFDLISFEGRWAQERRLQRAPVLHGKTQVFSTRGASGHIMNPSCMLAHKNATETTGDVYAFAFVYSGSFLISASRNFNDNTRLVMGINPENFDFVLESGEKFTAPEVAVTFSHKGFETASQNLHKSIRNNLCTSKFKNARRPILINNWEGTYFTFNADKLVSMAKDASLLGVELFVMDDGWFGKRDDDFSGLGDWFVNEEKLGCTLKELADRINETGLRFGIWFEPECVNEDSDLYRAHPDYAFKMPNRQPTLGRHQLILDMSRKDVRDNIYNQLCKILDSANISYVKWDFNRNITDLYSSNVPAEKQGEIYHRYVLGLYELLERITSRYPDILFESCSGGGGRFDCGMHYYMPQAWTSDDTDPIERLKIQHGTSFIYPISTMGAHVSACPNHQTGRITPLKTRGIVAYFGTYGLELDVNKMTDEEKTEIKRQVAEFKKHYELIQRGEYSRLISPYEKDSLYCVWQVVSTDKSEALVAMVKYKNEANTHPEIVRLRGLDENKYYKVNGEKVYKGASLMYNGLVLENLWGDYESKLYYIEEVK